GRAERGDHPKAGHDHPPPLAVHAVEFIESVPRAAVADDRRVIIVSLRSGSGGGTMDELFAAIKGRDQPTVERILAPDPALASAVDEHGVCALLTAVYHDNAPAAAALRGTGMELNVYEAAAVGDIDRVRALVDAEPALARSYGADGFHPLGLAAFFHHPAIVRVLIAAGADVSAPSRNRMRVTALHSAIAGSDRESALALIAAGADVNAK